MFADIDKHTLKQLNRVDKRRKMKYRDHVHSANQDEAEHPRRGRRSDDEVRRHYREALTSG